MIKALKLITLFCVSFISTLYAGDVITNTRLEGASLTAPGANLIARYDKYWNLPYPAVNPFALVNSSKGMIEFGIDETKKVFHPTNFTSILTVTYYTRDFNLTASAPQTQTLEVNYFPTASYKGQAIFKIDNVAHLEITSINVVSYKDYGLGTQALVSNPSDLYLEASVHVNENLQFDFSTSLPLTAKIGYNKLPTPVNPTELEAWWDYLPGAEEYELEYIYIDNYDASAYGTAKPATSINYDFEHDATRIVTTNQFYKIPLVYEKGWIIFRVRGIGRSQTNNNVRLEGTWSNGSAASGVLSSFTSAFSNQSFQILTAHEDDKINWSSSLTFDENGKSGLGISYEDGTMKNRQSVAKLNTEDKTMAQASLYDWQGRPAVSVLPTPLNDNFLSYKKDLNKTTTGLQFDKNVFDNAANFTSVCSPTGLIIDPVNSTGAAKYYSPQNNTGQDAQQALVPDAHGMPYVQVEYYPDQTGRIKRQSSPGSTHFLGSGKDNQFFYSQPTQEELVRLFGTEVGDYREYEKQVDIDPNGQKSVTYADDEGRTIATALMNASPSNLIPLADATNPLTSQTFNTTLVNNTNDPSTYTYGLTNTFFAAQNEIEQISYDVAVSQYTDVCLPAMCMDCIYELEISIKDDCGAEVLDGDPLTAGNQPVTKILGRYNPGATPEFPTNCISPNPALQFSLSNPTPFSFIAPKDGNYHLTKTLKLSDKPLVEYAEAFVKNDTCIQTLEDFQQQSLANIDLSGCDNLDCAQCSTTVNNFISTLPAGSITPLQQNELLAKCNLKCNLEQNICQAKEALLLKDFKPGGYFAKYDNTQTSFVPAPDPLTGPPHTYSVSIFNSQNKIENLVLGTSPSAPKWYNNLPVSYGSFTTLDPATNLPVAPNQLSVVDYVTTYVDDYSKPWLKLHPEYCRLQFNCDPLINAINSYTKTLEGINSFDDACRLGYLFAIPAAVSFPNAPNATTCPGCTGTSNHYIPLVGYSGSSYLSSSAIASQLSALTASLQSHSFPDDMGNLSPAYDIYQYAIVIGDNVGNPGSITFGGGCDKDKEWLFYKRIYMSYITTMMVNLEQSYVFGWNSANGGCLTNFSSLPGYVKIFPDINLMTTGALSGFGNGASTGSAGAAGAASSIAAQCTSYCHSYISNWISNLNGCSITAADLPNVTAALEAVCTAGCDAADPFGASNSNTPVTITLTGGGTASVTDFQGVLTAFGYNPTLSCNAYLINMPHPKGYSYSGAATTNPIIDGCGCDAILNAHNSYTTGVANSTIDPCLMSEADYVKQQLDVTLPYLSSYLCVCEQAKLIGGGYDFSGIDQNMLATLPLPEKLACQKCIPCNRLTRVLDQLNKELQVPFMSQDPVLVTNVLNNTLNMNNTYDEWMQFYQDCLNNQTPNNTYSGTAGLTFLTTEQALDFKDLFGALANNNFLIPNTSTTLYVLNSTNAPGFFTSTLMPATSAASSVSVQVTLLAANTLQIDLTSASSPFPCTYILKMPPSQVFPDFSTVSSVGFADIKGSCDQMNVGACQDFVCTLNYIDNTGALQSFVLKGTNTCFVTLNQPHIAPPQNGKCEPYLCKHSLGSEPIPPNNCLTTLINNALNSAQTLYNTYIAGQVAQFLANYKDYCYNHVTETTKRLYTLNEYHYTLYYYDRAGNLVHTVPPAGVSVITSPTDIANAVAYVNGTNPTPVYPAHSLNNPSPNITSYISHTEYNTFDAPTTQITPDGGQTRFFYDHIGRIGVAQDSKQEQLNMYSYTLYDDMGRINEVGVFVLSTAIGDVFTADILKNPTTWAAFLNAHPRTQVTHTYYDNPLNAVSNAYFPAGQQNLRNRVSATTYEDYDDSDPNVYKYASFFSYDDHGHVDHIVQHNTQLNAYTAVNELKHIEYEYDLISSNVNKVIYQRGQRDQWFHKYEYDADNRLHTVYTSNNDLVYQRDAKYFYYQHGPLARTELGEKQVQGTDYAFTIQGWVKGVNSNILNETKDIGKDGAAGNAYMSSFADVHKDFAKDASSFSLNYFSGDYNPIKIAAQNFLADMTNLNSTTATGFKLSADAPDLYNGNISSMVTSIYDINPLSVDKGKAKPQITGYRYDQLHRLKHMKAYSSMHIGSGLLHSEAINLAANQWITPDATTTYAGVYEMDLSYDKIGNIQTLKREGDGVFTGSGWQAKKMDALNYTYNSAPVAFNSLPGKQYTINSRLMQVTDVSSPATNANYLNDIDGTHAYDYNEIGSLTRNLSEDIDLIEWTDAKKVKSVIRTSTSMKSDIYFTYDAFGHRISKTVVGKSAPGVPDPMQTKTTHYVLDAEGNNMAIYEEEPGIASLKCVSRTIFGTERIGINNDEVNMNTTAPVPAVIPITFGKKDYESHNHLGNVITSVSDRKIQENGIDGGTAGIVDYYTPDIVSTTDYYAFGMAMPGRSIGSYRYAHNGQEKDNEIFDGALSAEFWEYDARTGRRWEQDPVPNVAISPYACFGNNPILISDPNGDVVPPIVSALVFGSLKALYSFSTQFTSIYGESLASWAWHKVFKRDAGGPPNLKTSFKAALNQIDYADVASAFVVGAIEGFFPLKGLAIGIIELVESAFNAAFDYTLGDEKGHRYRDKRRRFNTVFNTVEHKTLGEFAGEFFVDLIGKAVTAGMTAFEYRKESFKVIMDEVKKKLFPNEILTGPELFKDKLREFFKKELGKGLGGAGGGGIFKFFKNKFKEWNKHRKEHKAKYKKITKKQKQHKFGNFFRRIFKKKGKYGWIHKRRW